ncbi:hypothetical protein HRUBRA_01347 [Pseudohaliea rubra DSM 19751]|uniref:Post-segregation antitoxin CcdA n=1 Tax=Pseudohaliea rubra DSM 19751 TaxID=1265313 RepID=A0A095VSU5_9GAMM|nr:hypothetical protein HRUBRA_01347 [Pseudohaliea rubra DSM 19751]
MQSIDAAKPQYKPTGSGNKLCRSAEAVKRSRREQWLEDNADALAGSNVYVEAHGLPLARYRIC